MNDQSMHRDGSSVQQRSGRRPKAAHLASLAMLIFLLTGMIYIGSRSPVARAATGHVAVYTQHNDNARTGQNLNETILNTSNVNQNQFGKRVAYSVDGQVYAQPLYVPNVNGHNEVIVATEHDSVYAFDADQTSAVAPLWKTSFLTNGATTVSSADQTVFDVYPEYGITSTPVIDPSSNTLYTVAYTKESGTYVKKLHALDITNGQEHSGSPVVISASINGIGYDASGGVVTFKAFDENQRAGLVLVNGVVYFAFSSYGDHDPWHGWVFGYSASTLQQVAVYNDTGDGAKGGIWMSGAGLAADASNNIYGASGNGSAEDNNSAPTAPTNRAESYIKMSTQNGLQAVDWFTQFDHANLETNDLDVGSSGMVLLPDQSGAHPHVLIGSGKTGAIFVIDRDNMSKFNSDSDHILQEFPAGTLGQFDSQPTYWAGTSSSGQLLYMGGGADHVRAFHLGSNGLITGQVSQTPEVFEPSMGGVGVKESVSSNGSTPGTGILWVIDGGSCDGCGNPTGPATLHAFDATDLNTELYNTNQNASRDQIDNFVKFSTPTTADGKVFVGTQDSLYIFGLLSGVPTPTPTTGSTPTSTPSPTPTNTPTPTSTPVGGTWIKCADEGGTCTFSGTATVRYGANGLYFYQTATGSIGCNNGVFGDPDVGVVKECDYQSSTGTPTPTPTSTPTPTPTATTMPTPTPTGTPTSGGLPSPWHDTDLGSVGAVGSASYSGGTFTVKGSGADFYDASDSGHFVYQQVSGNVTIVARVASVTNTDGWTKAAVMVRNSLDPSDPMAITAVTPGNGVALQWRSVNPGLSNNTAGPNVTAPYWVKLVRVGNSITSYASSDGVTWTTIGSATVTLGNTIYVGLALTAHADGQLATATFDHVSVS